MRLSSLALIPAIVLGVAACTPAQTAGTTAPSSAAQMPQSANSLPAGASVTAPLAPTSGNVSATPIRR